MKKSGLFLSPSLSHLIRDFCFQVISECRRPETKFRFFDLWKNRSHNIFIQSLRSPLSRFNLEKKRYNGDPQAGCFQEVDTTSKKESYSSQNLSFLNGRKAALLRKILIKSGQWSDLSQGKCSTRILGKMDNHLLFAKTLSSLDQIERVLLHHGNPLLTNPTSIKPQSFTA